MKKTSRLNSYELERIEIRATIFATCLVVSHAIVYLIDGAVIRSLIRHFYDDKDLIGSLYFITKAFFWLVLPIVAYLLLTRKAKYDVKIQAYRQQRRLKKLLLLEEKILAEQQKRKELTEEMRDLYEPTTVSYTDELFVFLVTLSHPIENMPEDPDKLLLPTTTVNGIRVAMNVADSMHLRCFARKAISSENRTLSFKLGRHNAIDIVNPFYFDKACTNPIVWQCEGHGAERKIFIPAFYFPQVNEEAVIPFAVRVHKTSYGPYFGTFDYDTNMVVVGLNKDFHKSDCKNKNVTLILQYGTQHKITLPEPQLLIKDGKNIAVPAVV